MADWGKAWADVDKKLDKCSGIAWDGCHKIYILMDDKQMSKMKEYGYDPLISAGEMSRSEMLLTIKEWFGDSCGLRFVDTVKTRKDGTHKWGSLIGQGFGDYLEED